MSTGEALTVVAVILGAHGVRGDVRVKSFTEFPEDAFAYGPLLGEGGEEMIDAASLRASKDQFIVTPKHTRQKEEWDGLKGTLLHVPRAALPDTEDDEIYVEDLVGLSVTDPDGVRIGAIKAVQNFGAGDLIEIDPVGGGTSVFVPFTEEDVPAVNVSAGNIVVATYDLWADASEDEENV